MKLFVQDRLVAQRHLAKAEPGALKAVVKITGWAGGEKDVTFPETFTSLDGPGARSEQEMKEKPLVCGYSHH